MTCSLFSEPTAQESKEREVTQLDMGTAVCWGGSQETAFFGVIMPFVSTTPAQGQLEGNYPRGWVLLHCSQADRRNLLAHTGIQAQTLCADQQHPPTPCPHSAPGGDATMPEAGSLSNLTCHMHWSSRERTKVKLRSPH